jgi:hypothetical protein
VARKKLQKQNVFVVVEDEIPMPPDSAANLLVRRPSDVSKNIKPFVEKLRTLFEGAAKSSESEYLAEPQRLLQTNHYRAAVVSVIALLEACLQDRLRVPVLHPQMLVPLRQLIEHAARSGMIDPVELPALKQWVALRNSVAHSLQEVTKADAEEMVNGVLRVVRRLDDHRKVTGDPPPAEKMPEAMPNQAKPPKKPSSSKKQKARTKK